MGIFSNSQVPVQYDAVRTLQTSKDTLNGGGDTSQPAAANYLFKKKNQEEQINGWIIINQPNLGIIRQNMCH